MSCSQTNLYKLMKITISYKLLIYLCVFWKIAFKIGFKMIPEYLFKIIILGVADSHKI